MAFDPLPLLHLQTAADGRPRPRLALGEEVSIATAAYGNETATRNFLASLFGSVEGDYELILVDDCSPDDGATSTVFKEAAAVHHNTRIFSFPENQEYSGSVNAILSHARGDFVCFVSNDIFVTRNYFELLLAVAREEEGVGIVRGSSNFVDNVGLPSHNLAPIHEIHSLEDVFREGEDVATLFGTISVPDPYLTGDAFLVTRALLQTIGSFDPLFYGYFADHDFGLRSKIAGFRNLLVPGAFAYHWQGANFSYLSEQERVRKLNRRWARIYENWARFKLKYGLPVSLLYTSINDVPWQQLEQESLGKVQYFSPLGDYQAYLTYPSPVVNL